jgi:type II secretory pathway pseudopilin PulG
VEEPIIKPYQLKAHARQRGVTLLELTVILTIIIALAGMVIPTGFFAIMTSSQDSTGVSSLAEVDKWMQSYSTKFMKEPNNMEALINGVAGIVAQPSPTTFPPGCNTLTPAPNANSPALNAVYCNMKYPGYFIPLQLTSVDLASLNNAGITSLYYNDPNTKDATFDSTLASNTPLTTGGYVARVAFPLSHPVVWPGPTSPTTLPGATIEDYLAAVFGSTSNKFDSNCYDYVAFGIGNQSSLTGTVTSTAPVHFVAKSISTGTLTYNRYLAIYQVDRNPLASAALQATNPLGGSRKGCAAGIESAKFIGSVIADGSSAGQLMGLANSLASSANSANSNYY